MTTSIEYRTTKTRNRKNLRNLQNSIKQQPNKYDEYNIINSAAETASSAERHHHQEQQQSSYNDDDINYYYKQQQEPETEVNINSIPVVEIDMPQCPQGCVCQYAHLMDLPISRWINYMQQKYLLSPNEQQQQVEQNGDNENDEDFMNNDSSYGSEDYIMNPFVKQATCIIQEDTDTQELINSLPHDMQALILLYTGVGKNKTGNYYL